MRSRWGKLRLWGMVGTLASVAVLPVAALKGAQLSGSPPFPGDTEQNAGQWPNGNPRDRNARDNDPYMHRQQEKMAEARNTQRQQQLEKDTAKLLALATELKAEVDKTNKNTLSVDVVKKAEEIEKLAKSVKEKMRQ